MADPASLLEQATRRLATAGVPSARHDAEALLAFVTDTTRLRLSWSDPVPAAQEEAYTRMIERRASRVPLQHITGQAAFRTVTLAVGPGVFVPRPETELVAGAAIEAAGRVSGVPVVVDLCTGSGAIALAVATEVPDASVYACEIDPGAVAWAETNLAGSGVRLTRSDAAEAFDGTDGSVRLDGLVDVVVSNPPYIPLEAFESVEPEVRDHDPAAALWSGVDGLDAIRMIERTAARLLRSGGQVVVEHASEQGVSAPAVFAPTGSWTTVRDHMDLADRARYLTATRI